MGVLRLLGVVEEEIEEEHDCATAAVACHLECDNGKVNLINDGGEG